MTAGEELDKVATHFWGGEMWVNVLAVVAGSVDLTKYKMSALGLD
jgi:hypothetical protein